MEGRCLPPTTPLLHTLLRPAVLAYAPSYPIPQSLTGALRGAIEGVNVPTSLSSSFSQDFGRWEERPCFRLSIEQDLLGRKAGCGGVRTDFSARLAPSPP